MNHVVPKLGNLSLKTLRGERLQRFFNQKRDGGRLDRRKGGLSIKTLRNIRNILNACFEQAIFNKLIQTNLLIGVKLPRNESKGMRVLTTGEMKKLLDVAYGFDHPFAYGVIITLYTGFRKGDA